MEYADGCDLAKQVKEMKNKKSYFPEA